jgi:hypothetical protein
MVSFNKNLLFALASIARPAIFLGSALILLEVAAPGSVERHLPFAPVCFVLFFVGGIGLCYIHNNQIDLKDE